MLKLYLSVSSLDLLSCAFCGSVTQSEHVQQKLSVSNATGA